MLSNTVVIVHNFSPELMQSYLHHVHAIQASGCRSAPRTYNYNGEMINVKRRVVFYIRQTSQNTRSSQWNGNLRRRRMPALLPYPRTRNTLRQEPLIKRDYRIIESHWRALVLLPLHVRKSQALLSRSIFENRHLESQFSPWPQAKNRFRSMRSYKLVSTDSCPLQHELP